MRLHTELDSDKQCVVVKMTWRRYNVTEIKSCDKLESKSLLYLVTGIMWRCVVGYLTPKFLWNLHYTATLVQQI